MIEKIKKNKNFNLPNQLTTFRFLCIPLIVLFMSFKGQFLSFLGALFIGLAFITDMLDGYFARKHGEITVLGKFLDPLADKILVVISMIMLVHLDRVSVYIVIVIIARELAITGLRAIAVSEGIVIQASKLGKFKTIFQAVAILALTLHYEYFEVDFHRVGLVFIWIALALTLWSGWDYFRQFNVLFDSDKSKEQI
jgi:CDP-diacylglycerol--glycerol-3-phosphate 3-phosphatidyltransferase